MFLREIFLKWHNLVSFNVYSDIIFCHNTFYNVLLLYENNNIVHVDLLYLHACHRFGASSQELDTMKH